MSPFSFDYYQCLVCKYLFRNSWKVQIHLKNHSNEEVASFRTADGFGSKRGMLPIRKVTFADCFVPVVRNQIDPEFLKTYEQVLPYDDSGETENFSKLSPEDTYLNRNESNRPRRRCQLQATEKLKQIAALLKSPERLRPSCDRDSHCGNPNHFSDTKPKGKSSSNDNSDGKDSADFDIENQLKSKAPRRRRRNPMKISGPPKPNQNDKDADNDPQVSCPLPTCTTILNFTQLTNHIKRHLNAETKQIIYSLTPKGRKSILEKYSKRSYFKEKTFHCKFCLEKVLSISELQEHLINFHKEVSLECPQCKNGNDTAVDYQSSISPFIEHFRVEHNGRIKMDSNSEDITNKFRCPVCRKLFSRKKGLRRHFNLHLENNPFVCSIPECGRKFGSSTHLKRHEALHNGNFGEANNSTCNLCQAVFATKRRLVSHMATVHNTDSLPVVQKVIKGEIIYQSDNLEQLDTQDNSSLPIRSKEGKVEEKLTEAFSMENDPVYKEIVEKVPNGSLLTKNYANTRKMFSCRICPSKFFRAFSLQLHLKAVHGKTIAKDILQDKEDESIQKSEAVSSINVTLLCGACAYPAKDEKDLSSHMKTHLKQHWTCKWKDCRQIFDCYRKMYAHLRKVHPEAPQFPCKFCDETFLSEKKRSRHVKSIHKKQWTDANKRKTCELCQKSFVLAGYVSHMRKAHGKNSKELLRAKCMLCHDTFADSRVLQRHIACLHLGKDYNKVANAKYHNKKSKLSSESTRENNKKKNGTNGSSLPPTENLAKEAKCNENEDDQNYGEELSILGI